MTHEPHPAMGSIEWLLLLTLSVLWSASFLFSKIALAELRPFTVVLGRVALAAIVLNGLVAARGQRLPRSWRPWSAFLVMGALNNLIPFSLILYGQTRIASSLASILNATTPLFTVILAHWLTRDERLTASRAGGVVLGLVGVTVMIGPEALGGLGLNVLAQIAVIAAAVSYASAGIFGRRFRGVSPVVVAAGQVTATTVMVLPIALIVDAPWSRPAPGPITWGALAGLALLTTAAGYVIYFRILSVSGATNVLLVTLLMPVGASVLGMGILGERLDLRHFVGMGLIGLGLASIDGRPLAWLRARRSARAVPGVSSGARYIIH